MIDTMQTKQGERKIGEWFVMRNSAAGYCTIGRMMPHEKHGKILDVLYRGRKEVRFPTWTFAQAEADKRNAALKEAQS